MITVDNDDNKDLLECGYEGSVNVVFDLDSEFDEYLSVYMRRIGKDLKNISLSFEVIENRSEGWVHVMKMRKNLLGV